jgi:hypothetical protein
VGGAGSAGGIDGGVSRSDRPQGRWLTLGAMAQIGGEGGGGLRAELDIKRRGKWSIGAALAGSSSNMQIDDGLSGGYLDTVDVRLLATLARTTQLGRWDMKLSLGAGVMSTYAEGELGTERLEAQGVFPTAEASVMFGREFRGGWGFAVGPIVTWYSQSFTLDYNDGGMTTLSRRDLQVMAFGGIRHRL